jgi:hypothetical protein
LASNTSIVKFRVAASALALALLSSCSVWFNREYYSEEPYVADYYVTIPETDIQEVRNYIGMRDALESMVSAHVDRGTIRTNNYSGNVVDDFARAQNHIKYETPLGAFAVDYITPGIKEYLTYYEIDIRIYYTHTPGEIAQIKSLTTAELLDELDRMLLEFDSDLTFEIATLKLTESAIVSHVTEFCKSHPDLIPMVPTIVVNTYPGMADLRKIIVLELRYPYTRDVLFAMRMNFAWARPDEPSSSFEGSEQP